MSRQSARGDHAMRTRRGTLDKFLFSHGQENMQVRANTSVITAQELRKIREQITDQSFNKASVSVVSKTDLDRIRKQVIVKDKTQVEEEKRLSNEQRTKQMAVAMARKQRMQAQDRERAANAPLEVRQNTFGENTLLAKAQDQMDEGYDDVKHMNQMMLSSKIFTIRDRQLAENKQLEATWVEEQRRLDLMMEIERLKAIKAEHEREERAAQARKRGAQVLIDQIASRQEQRQKEEQMLEREKAQLLANIEKVKKEDEEALVAKRQRVKVMSDEIKVANKAALAQKEAARQTEKRLDAEIAEHTRKKQAREEEKLREDARIKEEKEKEIQRLRDLQERANDRQAELDQVRAQKAFEKAELENRAQEEAKRQRHEAELSKLHVDRQRQFADNDQRVKEVARKDREQFLEVVRRQKLSEQEERQQMASRRQAFLRYKTELNSQMKKNEELRQIEKHAQVIEGKKNRLLIDQERNRIDMIKAQKVSAVKQLGIQDRYTAELEQKKATF